MVTSGITASGYVRGYQKHSGDQLLLVGWFGRRRAAHGTSPDQGCSWRPLQ